jgi:hypothetical protein
MTGPRKQDQWAKVEMGNQRNVEAGKSKGIESTKAKDGGTIRG